MFSMGKYFVQKKNSYQLGQPSDTQFTGQAYLKNKRELGRAKGTSIITKFANTLPIVTTGDPRMSFVLGANRRIGIELVPARR